MSKTLLWLLLLAFGSELFADFKQSFLLTLKKDELERIEVRDASGVRLFAFRWTLFKNGGLVIHRAYDKISSQNILYQREKNRSFRVELQSRGKNYANLPYLLVVFKEFANKEAVFEILLYDKLDQIHLKRLKSSDAQS